MKNEQYIPKIIQLAEKVPGGKEFIDSHLNYLTATEMIDSLSGEKISEEFELQKNKSFSIRIVNAFFIKRLLESESPERLVSNMIKRYSMIDVMLTLGNRCNHDCKDYCMLKAHPKGNSINMEDFKNFINKYGEYTRYVRWFYILGQEFLAMDDFEKYLEELLKLGINNLRIVTRGAGSIENNRCAIRKIEELKLKYPAFNFYFAISLDGNSSIYKNDHEAKIRNLSELIMMQLKVFGHKDITIQTNSKIKRRKGKIYFAPGACELMNKEANEILSLLENEGIMHLKTTQGYGKLDLEMSDGINIELTLAYQKNVYGEKKYSHFTVNQEDSPGKPCETIGEPFRVFFDEKFSLDACTSFHAMFYHKKNTIVNALTEEPSEIFKAVIESRKRFFAAMSYVDLARYLAKPGMLKICDKI